MPSWENITGATRSLNEDFQNWMARRERRQWREEDLTRQDLRQGYDAAREAMRLETAGGEYDPERIQEAGLAAFQPWISQYPDESQALNQWVESVAASYVPSERARMGSVLEGVRLNPFIGEDPKLAQAQEMLRASGLEETLGPGEVGPRKPPIDYVTPEGSVWPPPDQPMGRELQPNMARMLDVATGQQRQDWAQTSQNAKVEDLYKQFLRPDGSTAHVVEIPDPSQPGRYEAWEIPAELVNQADIFQMMRRIQQGGLNPAAAADVAALAGNAPLEAAMTAAEATDAVADSLKEPDAPPTPPSPPGTPVAGFQPGSFPQAPVGGVGGWETAPGPSGITGNQGMGRLLYVKTPQGIDWGAGGGQPLQAVPTSPPPPTAEPAPENLLGTVAEFIESGEQEQPWGMGPSNRARLEPNTMEQGAFSVDKYPYVYTEPRETSRPGQWGMAGHGADDPTQPRARPINEENAQTILPTLMGEEVRHLLTERQTAQARLDAFGTDVGEGIVSTAVPFDPAEISMLQDRIQAINTRLGSAEEVWGQMRSAGWDVDRFPSLEEYPRPMDPGTGMVGGARSGWGGAAGAPGDAPQVPLLFEPPEGGSTLPPGQRPPMFPGSPPGVGGPGEITGQMNLDATPSRWAPGGQMAPPSAPGQKLGPLYDPAHLFPQIDREELPNIPPSLEFLQGWQPSTVKPPGIENWLASQPGGPPFTQPPPTGGLPTAPTLPPGIAPPAPPDVERREPSIETAQGTAMPDTYQDELHQASTQYDVAPELMAAVAQQENAAFNPKAQARAMNPLKFNDLLDTLQELIWEETGRDTKVTDRKRTQAQQAQAHASGASQLPGTPGQESSHQTGHGADLYFTDPETGEIEEADSRENEDLYAKLGETAERLGLRWGGRWKIRDLGHVESPPTGVGLWQVNPTTALDPGYGLNDDFQALIAGHTESMRQQGLHVGETDFERAFNALLEPGINAQMAAAYLKALYEATPEKDWEEALASYVMGPQAVKDQPHWRASNPKIQEYVTAIMRNWGGPNVPGLSRRGLHAE